MHHKYKDRGQGLSIRVKHRKFMDHTRSIHPTPRIALSVTKFQPHHTHMQHRQGLRIADVCTSCTYGEIQFSRRILNFSSLMFIHMFFIDFLGLCDEKIHSRAQLFFFLIFFPFLHVSCPDMIIDIFSELYEVGILNE